MKKIVFIASEEGGPGNKLGGIWEVVYNEAKLMSKKPNVDVYVVGPYFKEFDDWSPRKRITKIDDLEPYTPPDKIAERIEFLTSKGSDIICGVKDGIKYILIRTNKYDTILTNYKGKTMRMGDYIKAECYELTNIRSELYENTYYGKEYEHYLYLSWAISELARVANALHAHEYPTFYAIARSELLNMPVKTVATFHATKWGRAWGREALKKIENRDNTFPKHIQEGLVELEKLARYADIVTFVGSTTRREAEIAYGISGIIVRNGIYIESDVINWEKKRKCNEKIKEWIVRNLREYFNYEIDPKYLLVWYTISRAEIYNKGYDVLADALRIRDIILQNKIKDGVLPEETREVFIMITSLTPKPKRVVEQGFPFILPKEILADQELLLVNEILEPRKLTVQEFIRNKRYVLPVPYLTWLHKDDGGLNMNPDEVAAGSVGAVFPSYYEPFLLTSLETGREATPAAVSEVCGIKDAIEEYLSKTGRVGGVFIIRNMHQDLLESSASIAYFMDIVDNAYFFDKQKYKMMCIEHFELARGLSWEEPVEKYYRILTL